jgi:hypothetical protein
MASVDSFTKESRYASVSLSREELVKRRRDDKPVWQMILEIMSDVPRDDLNRLPTDASEEHDHYIYDTPKRNPSQ